MPTFIDLAILGEAEDDEIDDFVEQWHRSDDTVGSIFTYLGMAEDEYAAWALDPDVLPHIIAAHKSKMGFRSILAHAYEQRLAARSDSADKLAIIKSWLEQQT